MARQTWCSALSERVLSVVAAALVLAPSIPASAAEGGGKVDPFYGAYNTEVPIEVPKFHGLEPSLKLTYSSTAGNGFAGVGWSLQGFSTIERASPGKGAPKYDATDIFLLDGQELVPCTALGGTHCTKLQSYQRIQKDVPSAGQWTVTQKNGTKSVYGAVYVVAPGTFRWGLTSVTDTHGNTVSYGWWCDPSADCYPSTVSYNGTTVTLYREARPDPIRFANGSDLGQTNYRLKTIDVTVSGSRARAYKLTYTTSASTSRSLLASVQQFGKDATLDASGWITNETSASKLPAMTVAQVAPANAFGSTTAGPALSDANGWSLRQYYETIRMAEVNGDGKADLVARSSAGIQTYLSNGNGTFGAAIAGPALSDATGWNQPQYYSTIQTADVNGDGKADLVGRGSAGIQTYLSNGNGTFGAAIAGPALSDATSWNLPQYYATIRMADVNGDGKADLVARGSAGIQTYLSNGNGTFGAAIAGPALSDATSWNQPQYYSTIQTADVNGDAKADLVGRGSAGIQTYLSNGNGTFGAGIAGPALSDATGWNQSRYHSSIRWADVNGDGKADLVARDAADIKTWLSKGNGTFAAGVGSGLGLVSITVSDVAVGASYPSNSGSSAPSLPAGSGNSLIQGYAACGTPTCGTYGCVFPCTPYTRTITLGGGISVSTADVAGTTVNQSVSICPALSYTLTASGNTLRLAWTTCQPLCGYGCNVAAMTPHTRTITLAGTAVSIFSTETFGLLTGSGNALTASNWTRSIALTSSFEAADVNGDGRANLCGRSSTGMYCGLSKGDGTFGSVVTSAATGWGGVRYDAIMPLADVNGDGKADLLGRSATGGMQTALMALGQPDAVSSISNGLGGTTTIAYAPSSASANTYLPVGMVTQTVASVTTADGRGGSSTTSYSYAGGLWSDAERRFLGFRKVTAVIDAAGNYTETYYHQHVGCISKPETTYFKSATGAIYTYSSYGYQESAAAPYTSLLTERWDYECDLGATCQRVVSQLSYDGYGNITTASEYGNYDAAGDERTTVRGFVANPTSYIVGQAAYENVYEGIGTAGRLMSRELRLHDGATSEAAAPLRGDMTARKRWNDQTGGYVTEAFAYDAYGNVTSEGDGRGYAKTTAYDAIYHVYPVSRCDALGHCAQTSYDAALGVATAETDAGGNVLARIYDALGRAVRETRPDGGWTEWQYLQWGDPGAQRVRRAESDGSADGLWADEYFDGMQRSYKWVREGGATRLREYSGTTTRVWKESAFHDPATESPRYQVFAYDGAARVVRVTSADGTYGETAYAVCHDPADADFAAPRACTTRWDELGNLTRRARDGLGNLVNVSEWNGGEEARTHYERDVLSRLVRVVDAAGNVSSKAWDSLGNELAACDPDLGCWSYGYDAAGNRVSSTDARGQTVTVAYDAVGRRVHKALPGGAQVSWTYDQAGHGAAIGGDRPTSVAWAEGSESLSYDFAGRVTGAARCVLGVCQTTGWTYDGLGRVASVSYGDGTVVTQSYDGAGRLAAVGGYASGMTYNARGQLTQLTFGNGVVQQYSYDGPRQWLTSSAVTGPAGTLYQASYGYDAAARVASMSSTTDSRLNLAFGYDDLGRLLSVAGGQTQAFTYDALGNMTSNSQVGSYGYGDAAHRHAVTAAGTGAYAYDAAGNLVSGGGRTLEWDAESRLLAVTRDGQTATFSYDPDGQRTARTNAAGTTRFFGKLLEQGPDGGLVKYVYAGPLLVAQVRATGRSYVHQDHLGSVQLLTDAAGSVARRYDYAAYGQTAYDSGGAANARGFGGHETDADSGLVYMNARYYDAELGRFLSADTLVPDLGNPQALNRYAFAYGNPISNIDPSGHAPVVVAVIVASSASAAVATVAWIGVAFIAVGYVTNDPLLMTIGAICLGYAGGFGSALLEGTAGGVLGASVAALTSPLSPLDDSSKRMLGLVYMGANFVAGQMKSSEMIKNKLAVAKERLEHEGGRRIMDCYNFANEDAALMAADTLSRAAGTSLDAALRAGLADSGPQFGMVGPGSGVLTTVLDRAVGWIPSVRLHSVLHDGYGLAFQQWHAGPGFNYAGADLGSTGDWWSGQLTGLFRNTFLRPGSR